MAASTKRFLLSLLKAFLEPSVMLVSVIVFSRTVHRVEDHLRNLFLSACPCPTRRCIESCFLEICSKNLGFRPFMHALPAPHSWRIGINNVFTSEGSGLYSVQKNWKNKTSQSTVSSEGLFVLSSIVSLHSRQCWSSVLSYALLGQLS